MKRILLTCCNLVLFLHTGVSMAEWNVVTNADDELQTLVAATTNNAGYRLEIYRDSVSAIRSRFTLPAGLLALPENSCPTFQIDKGLAQNLSVNQAPCLAGKTWSEFILGYVANDRVESSTLLGLMNGITIYYRFRLANGDYRQTEFSLAGSKRALTEAIGEQVVVARSPQ